MLKSHGKEIRQLVLKKLKELHGDSMPVMYGMIASASGISNEDMERHIKYWEEKGFVKTTSIGTPSQYSQVMLTAYGIDYLEGEDLKPSVIQNQEQVKGSGMNAFWDLLHPKIVEVSKSRFETSHFADSVEAALKEVNNIVKGIVKHKTGQEFDGADLMHRAFSLSQPIIVLDDLSTDTGKNIQKGYLQIFSGAMTGIRNPKAHENIVISSQRAIHFLFLASLLMFKIDEKK